MKRIIVRLSLGCVALELILCGIGAFYQLVGTRLDSHRFPQQGRWVSIGSKRLNLDCSGRGTPTVILDSGRSIPAIGWFKVQTEVARRK